MEMSVPGKIFLNDKGQSNAGESKQSAKPKSSFEWKTTLATPENAHSPQPTNLQHQFYQYVLVTEFFESRVFSAFAKLSFLYLEIEGYHYETHTTV